MELSAHLAKTRFASRRRLAGRSLLTCCVFLPLLLPGAAAQQQRLDYQERPYAFEGVRASPVSGFDLELLSARMDFQDAPEDLKPRLQLKFYLDRPRPAYVVVRELEPRFYYWLDKVKPRIDGRSGFENIFSWPTDEVLRQLRDLRPYDLGVVVRLDAAEPAATETVAPALFYQSALPAEITGYVFSFKLRNDARLRAKVIDEATGADVFAADLGKVRGGRPFEVRWNLARARPGLHRLVLSGYALENNEPIAQIVRFLHVPLGKSDDRPLPVR